MALGFMLHIDRRGSRYFSNGGGGGGGGNF